MGSESAVDRDDFALALKGLGGLHGRVGELEGSLTVLLDQARREGQEVVIRLTPDQFRRIRSLVGREEVRDGE